MRFNPYITSQASVTRQPLECALSNETLAKYSAIPSPAESGGNYVICGIRQCGGCFEPLSEQRKPWRCCSPHQLPSQGSALSSVRHRWTSLSFYPMLCRFPLLIWCLGLRRVFQLYQQPLGQRGVSYDCRWYCTR